MAQRGDRAEGTHESLTCSSVHHDRLRVSRKRIRVHWECGMRLERFFLTHPRAFRIHFNGDRMLCAIAQCDEHLAHGDRAI